MKQNQKFSVYDMCVIGIFTAVISILAQIAIPMPSGVPFTLQSFAITLTAVILGAKKGTVAVFIYLLLGTIGIPVFSNFRGGLPVLISPTGGFLISFPVMAFLIGFGAEKRERKWFYPWMLLLSNIVNYSFGVLIYCVNTGTTIIPAFFVCVLPFLPSTILTVLLGSFLGFKIRQKFIRISAK